MKFSYWRFNLRSALLPSTFALGTVLLGACASWDAKIPMAGQAASTSASTTALTTALTTAQITQIVASPDRSASDQTNDLRRKPAQMLAFIGIRPGMVALDISSGGGYTTELLARAVGPSGRVYGQSEPPRNSDSPARPVVAPEGDSSPTAPATTAASASASAAAASSPAVLPASASPPVVRRTSAQALAERAKNPVVANIAAVVQPFEAPVPPGLAGKLDLATLMFNYHDLGHLGVDRARMNQAVFAGLKSGGIYVIADHSGRPGTGISESGTLHRIEEAFLRQEVEAAGFRLADHGDFLRNPSDPRDKNTPNPPQPKDEFVLKFVKP